MAQDVIILLEVRKSRQHYSTMLGGHLKQRNHHQNAQKWDFPGGAVVKNLPANAGDTGSSPGPGKSHMLRSN